MRTCLGRAILPLLIALACLPNAVADEEHGGRRGPGGRGPGWGEVSGLPAHVLAAQSSDPVRVPPLEDAVRRAFDAARLEVDVLLKGVTHPGRRLAVPGSYASIQAAIDAAEAGDVVVVGAGTWRELLTMKDGVKLVSDASNGGDDPVSVDGAHLRLPKRAMRTVIDGTGQPSGPHGLIDFPPGSGRLTVVDGFTLQNLPKQNHHRPGHAHAVNLRGASPVVANCLIRDNGSTGIGSHVVYRDQGEPMAERDFRWANVEHQARAVIHGNIVRGNLGRGIGCNHYAAPWILGNEVFANDDSALGEATGPGIGMKHGAAPSLVGNVVHDNPGGGISCKVGEPQGAHPIDRPPRPEFRRNVLYANGEERPALSCRGAGTKRMPVRFDGNVILLTKGVGIGVSGHSVAILEMNLVAGCGLQGIALAESLVLHLTKNRVTECRGPGIVMVAGSVIREMSGNASVGNRGPAYIVRGATFGPGEDARAR